MLGTYPRPTAAALLVFARALLAATLLLSGCSSATNSDEAVALSGNTDSVSTNADSAAPTDTNPTRIRTELVAALFPASAQDTKSLATLTVSEVERRNLLIEGCMSDAGFDYAIFRGDSAGDRYFDFPDLPEIAETGFGLTAPTARDTQLNPYDGVPEELRDQFLLDLDQCTANAVDAVATDPDSVSAEEVFAAAAPLQDLWFAEIAVIDKLSEVVQAFEDWKGCMSASGYNPTTHVGFFVDVDENVIPLLETDFEAARQAEMAVANTYAQCMEPVEAIRQPIRDDARAAFLSDYSEEIRALEELFDSESAG